MQESYWREQVTVPCVSAVYASQHKLLENCFHIISIQLFDSVNHSMKELYLKAMY